MPLKKKNAILSLLEVVPRRNRLFWVQINENEDSQDLMCSNEMERRKWVNIIYEKTLNFRKFFLLFISYGFHELICNHKQKAG